MHVVDNHLIASTQIRQAEQKDLISLEWEGEYIHFRRMYQDAYEMAQNGDGIIWIMELPEKGLVGQLLVSLHSSRSELADGVMRAYIYGFRIRPAFRNRGLGEYFLGVVEKDLRQRGYQFAMLNVGRDNLSAIRLYERMGYRITSPESGHWFYIDHQGNRCEVFEPAWRMEKNL